jgi:hypothetical protein
VREAGGNWRRTGSGPLPSQPASRLAAVGISPRTHLNTQSGFCFLGPVRSPACARWRRGRCRMRRTRQQSSRHQRSRSRSSSLRQVGRKASCCWVGGRLAEDASAVTQGPCVSPCQCRQGLDKGVVGRVGATTPQKLAAHDVPWPDALQEALGTRKATRTYRDMTRCEGSRNQGLSVFVSAWHGPRAVVLQTQSNLVAARGTLLCQSIWWQQTPLLCLAMRLKLAPATERGANPGPLRQPT